MPKSRCLPAMVGAAALTLFAVPAGASVPALSGKYALGGSGTCQALESGSSPGAIESVIETAKFDPATGMVKQTATSITGDLLAWTGTTGYHTKRNSKTVTYSNTATTLTLNGITYNIVYGTVTNGIAQFAAFNGFDKNGCAITATMTRE